MSHSEKKVDFVSITADGGDKGSGTSCFSDLGRIGGKQILNLDISCLRNHTIVHELMHTVGMFCRYNLEFIIIHKFQDSITSITGQK